MQTHSIIPRTATATHPATTPRFLRDMPSLDIAFSFHVCARKVFRICICLAFILLREKDMTAMLPDEYILVALLQVAVILDDA
ncbi:unnamed protein product [marine sediment metagenome]|uniref:Uncharacterized protein n=1 Tax=marine sediment metagenome TaxID=412755 RepID=X1UKZ8_9ZZZZ